MNIDGKMWVSADYPHLRIPKRLLTDQQFQMLSPEAVVTYAAMMDRTSLSKKNQGKFTNSKNEIFIYYPQHEIMELLGCGHDKAAKVLRELIDARLIKVRRCGIGKPYEIVLIPIDWRTIRKNKNEQPEKPLRDSEETDYSLCGKTDGNNNDINNYELSNCEYDIRNYLKGEIRYEELIHDHDPILINRILDVAVNALLQETDGLLNREKSIPAEILRKKLRNLGMSHILYVIKKIKNATYTTEHSDTFILNALYEAISI